MILDGVKLLADLKELMDRTGKELIATHSFNEKHNLRVRMDQMREAIRVIESGDYTIDKEEK